MGKRTVWILTGTLFIAIAGSFLGYYLLSGESLLRTEAEYAEIPEDTVVVYEPVYYFGFNSDSITILEGTVKRNQHLSTILTNHNVSNETIHELAQAAKGVYDVRKIGVRKPYELIIDKSDTLGTARAMIYYPNKVEYVVFNLDDSIHVTKGEKEVVVAERTVSGIIYNSLALTIDELGLSPELTNEIADVFAWEIDFFRLFPGDRFKVIYEEELVDGEVIGYGNIKAAVFEHMGEDYYAFFYDQGTGIDYFDEEGNSLKKTLLKYPIKFTRISSRYSGSRYHPVQKRYKAHRGTDFAAPKGTPIRSVGDGVIVEAKYGKYNGNFVKIKHNSIYSTQYLHMSKIASGIRPGTRVKQGQTIGYVGSTGLARGNHLCYRFWKHGSQVDALKVDIPSSEPVREDAMPEFSSRAANFKSQLQAIDYPEEPMTQIGQ